MLLTELENLVLDITGEFLLGDITALQLDHNRFYRLVRRCIGIYEGYRPLEKRFNLTTTQKHTFRETDTPNGIPSWVSAVIPIGIPIAPFANLQNSGEMNPGTFIYRYDKPDLYLSQSGSVDVSAIFPYLNSANITSTGAVIEQVDMPDIDEMEHEHLIDLLCGHFLVSIGRSRRAFTVDDVQISNDAAEMVQEGQDRISEAKEALGERSKWWLAIPSA